MTNPKQKEQSDWRENLKYYCSDWAPADNNKMKRVLDQPRFVLIQDLIEKLLAQVIQKAKEEALAEAVKKIKKFYESRR